MVRELLHLIILLFNCATVCRIQIQTVHCLHLGDQRQDGHSHYVVNARSNKNVFSLCLNALWSVIFWSSVGSLFQALGPACEKHNVVTFWFIFMSVSVMAFLCALNSVSIEPQWKVSCSDLTTSVVLLSFHELSLLDLRDTVKHLWH